MTDMDDQSVQNLTQAITVFSTSIRFLAESIDDLAISMKEHNDQTKLMLNSSRGPVDETENNE